MNDSEYWKEKCGKISTIAIMSLEELKINHNEDLIKDTIAFILSELNKSNEKEPHPGCTFSCI